MIVITGIGMISPSGIGTEQVLASLSQSLPGISDAHAAGFEVHGVRTAGAVRNFTVKDFIPAMAARRMSRFSRLAVASAVSAVRDSGLVFSDANQSKTGVAVGTGLASTSSTDTFYQGLLREGPDGTNPMVFPETVQNIGASHIAMHFGITGPNITFSQMDASSEMALSYCCGLLENGEADAAVVCGSDELSVSLLTGYSSLGLLSAHMKPFDRGRSGFVAGEGGASLVLERIDDARRRGAHVYAIVSSVSFGSAPAGQMRYDDTGRSMTAAMQGAMRESGIDFPGCISAAADGSPDLDRYEADAIREVFGSAHQVPVTALRAYNGYFPSDGMLRIAAAVLCMRNSMIPAVPGLTDPLYAGGLGYVMNAPLLQVHDSVMINSFSAGGNAASVLLRKA